MDPVAHNARAWDREVELANPWTQPVSAPVIAAARRGLWSVLLTNTRPAPREWFPRDMTGVRVLALAAGGGQQGSILAAAGANVTVFDASERQLAQDRAVSERDGLDLRTEQGTMTDLSRFAAESFDLVVNPVSAIFIPDPRPVWQECFRVLRPGGELLAGFCNPATYLFDRELEADGVLQVAHALPYADAKLPAKTRDALFGMDAPLEWSHTLETLLGGQTEAGFHIVGFYEDRFGDSTVLDKAMAGLFATRALKPPARR
jgi:2-polyprenyl-3-methyl-5-hydroxy-6-metoxy-1,4-benzoquinol methylase